MSEFFLELFSEEIPPRLQTDVRKKIFLDLNKYFEENNIKIKGSVSSFSTPNRIIIGFSSVIIILGSVVFRLKLASI